MLGRHSVPTRVPFGMAFGGILGLAERERQRCGAESQPPTLVVTNEVRKFLDLTMVAITRKHCASRTQMAKKPKLTADDLLTRGYFHDRVIPPLTFSGVTARSY
jgi:hypothetical protein